MKIAFFIPSNRNVAPIKVIESLASGLTERGYLVDVYALEIFTSGDIININNIKKFSLFGGLSFRGYDILHSSGLLPDFFIFSRKFLLKFGSCKTVTTLHSELDKDFFDSHGGLGLLVAYFWWFMVSFFNARVFLNRYQLSQSKFMWSSTNNFVIPNGLDLSPPNFCRRARPRAKILFCGALRKIKGVDTLLSSLFFTKLHSIDIAGNADSAYGRRCIDFVNANKFSGRVNFLGYVKDMKSLYHAYDILVVPSVSEGFGLVVLEALSNGMIVVCSDIPSFRELFFDLPVLFFRVGDPIDLAKTIEDAILNPMPVNKVNINLTSFSKSAMVDRYIGVYGSVSGV